MIESNIYLEMILHTNLDLTLSGGIIPPIFSFHESSGGIIPPEIQIIHCQGGLFSDQISTKRVLNVHQTCIDPFL